MIDFIERYRILIGSILVLLILIGGGVLVWNTQTEKTSSSSGENSDLANLRNENKQLREQLETISQAALRQQANSTPQSGQVAGATVESPASSQKPSSAEVVGKININTADLTTLDRLPGIGPAKAQAIIDYRESNGPFQSIEDLIKVKGIGEKTFEKLKDLITI